MTVMGSIDDVEAGIRQLRRTVGLETQRVDLGNNLTVTVPTLDETLRVKAYLVVQRNQVRDYLDVAAMAHRFGIDRAAHVLSRIDSYYRDRTDEGDAVSTVLTQRLAEPDPKDHRVISQLSRYKALDQRWHDWSNVTAVTSELARLILTED